MIKFGEIGNYKVAKNFGYLTTDVALKNGDIVTYDLATKKVALPTSDTAKKAGLAVVMNVIDKPGIKTPDDYTIEAGEHPRIFTLASLKGLTLVMNDAEIKTNYASIAVGDKLVAGTDGKLVKTSDVSGYAEYLEVIEKVAFGGNGLVAVVKA